jgi:hypothetical protein
MNPCAPEPERIAAGMTDDRLWNAIWQVANLCRELNIEKGSPLHTELRAICSRLSHLGPQVTRAKARARLSLVREGNGVSNE